MSEYDSATSLSSYYPGSDARIPSRLWAAEKLLIDMAQAGLVEIFKGPGPDPTVLTGFGPSKIWLRQNPGVQPQQGAILAWTGFGSSGDPAQWMPLTFEKFRELIVGGLTPVDFAVSITTWFAALPTDPTGLPSGDFWNNGGTLAQVP